MNYVFDYLNKFCIIKIIKTHIIPTLQKMKKVSKIISLAILSGGKASRLGGINKGLIEYNGQSFISMIIKELSSMFFETLIISNSPEEFNDYTPPVYKDIYKNKGPLGGIHTALLNARNNAVFIVSCDMPFVKLSIANRLLSNYKNRTDAIIPKINGHLEPLFGIYSRSGSEILDKMLLTDKSFSIRKYLDLINTDYVDIPYNNEARQCFTNINTTDDLKMIRKTEIK